MYNLYFINMDLNKLFSESIDPETGEMLIDPDEFQKQYEMLMAKHDNVLEETALSCKEDLAMIEAMEAEISKIKSRIDSRKASADRKKKLLIEYCHGENFETPRVAVKFRKSESVIVSDEDSMIRWAKANDKMNLIIHKEVITEKPDKAEIKKYLKNGGECDYASSQQNMNVSTV